jgi:ABC-type spermidine/putrescine transport system permease subunit II
LRESRGQTRQGVTPLVNAVAAMMLLITLAVLLFGQAALGWNARRSGSRGQVAGVAGIVAENAGGG